MRTNVYVDGFNLYFRLLKDRPSLKWLNLAELSRQLLKPPHHLQTVRFYTARVSGRLDPTAPARQQIYLNALSTVPEITVHHGNFLVTKKHAGLVHPPQMKGGNIPAFQPPYPDVVMVHKIEEKGSDVNLACHLLRDAFQGTIDAAAVLTNDTDLAEPIRILTKELNVPVILLCPVDRPAADLRNVASDLRHIRLQHLAAAQFPDPIPGTTIQKPASWN